MKELINNLKFAWNYAKYQKFKIIKFMFANLLSAIFSIILPILSARAVVLLTDNKFYQIISIAIVIFFIENIRNLLNYLMRYYGSVIYRETFTKVQIDLGSQILKLENRVIDSNSSGLFIQRITNDTSRLADVFNSLIMNLSNIITDIGIFGAIFIINKLAFLYLATMTVILYLVDRIRVKKFNLKDKIFRKEQEKVAGFIGEIVRGSKDIKMLNAENSFIEKIKEETKGLNKNRYNMQKPIEYISQLEDLLVI